MKSGTQPKLSGLSFSPWEILALASQRKSQFRVPVTAENSTVDGYATPRTQWAWKSLDFANATARTTSTLMEALAGPDAPEDIHLRVPRPEEETFHRVRSRWEVGQQILVKGTDFRLTLESIKVHRVSEISEADAIAEGAPSKWTLGNAPGFMELFYARYGDKLGIDWSSAWTWACTFRMEAK